jgi:hypothetical protein
MGNIYCARIAKKLKGIVVKLCRRYSDTHGVPMKCILVQFYYNIAHELKGRGTKLKTFEQVIRSSL